MLMPKRVKHRMQFRGNAERQPVETRSITVNTVLLQLKANGLSPIRLKQPVLLLHVISSVAVRYGLKSSLTSL